MKSIPAIALLLLSPLCIYAHDIDQTIQLFHDRILERSPEYFENAEVQLVEELPEEIEQIASYHFLELVNFAIEYDLFAKGFDYRLNDNFYKIVDPEGLPLTYTFSVTIFKHGKVSSIGHYELTRRVDGVFYLANEPAWY